MILCDDFELILVAIPMSKHLRQGTDRVCTSPMRYATKFERQDDNQTLAMQRGSAERFHLVFNSPNSA